MILCLLGGSALVPPRKSLGQNCRNHALGTTQLVQLVEFHAGAPGNGSDDASLGSRGWACTKWRIKAATINWNWCTIDMIYIYIYIYVYTDILYIYIFVQYMSSKCGRTHTYVFLFIIFFSSCVSIMFQRVFKLVFHPSLDSIWWFPNSSEFPQKTSIYR